jgi:hypothetical protein
VFGCESEGYEELAAAAAVNRRIFRFTTLRYYIRAFLGYIVIVVLSFVLGLYSVAGWLVGAPLYLIERFVTQFSSFTLDILIVLTYVLVLFFPMAGYGACRSRNERHLRNCRFWIFFQLLLLVLHYAITAWCRSEFLENWRLQIL